MSDEYRALVDKVGVFTADALERRRADMACRSGCDGCCHVWLSVSPVEGDAMRAGLAALSPAARADVVERGARERLREDAHEPAPRCAMLSPDGSCVIYGDRPLVCRTQGYALRYPAGFIPQAAVHSRSTAGEVTYCPLNFTAAAPDAPDVLDAERVDQLLALVNHRFAHARGLGSLIRHSVSDVAAHADDPLG